MNVVEQLFIYSDGFSDTVERNASPNWSLLHQRSLPSSASNSPICHRLWRFCKLLLYKRYLNQINQL